MTFEEWRKNRVYSAEDAFNAALKIGRKAGLIEAAEIADNSDCYPHNGLATMKNIIVGIRNKAEEVGDDTTIQLP